MLVGVSASQGQGKTSVLTDLAKMGYNVIHNRTSRSILESWGYTLSEINSYAPLAVKFQDEIVKVHQKNNAFALTDLEKIFLQERTFADIMAYAITTDVGSNNKYSEWVDTYYETCKSLQRQYSCVIYLTGRQAFAPEADGVRSINKHYQKVIDTMIKNYVKEFDMGNVLYVDTPDHNERLKIISKHLDRLIDDIYEN